MPKLSDVHASYLGDVIDDRPGAYYVSIIDGGRFSLALGPFPSHAEALAKVGAVNAYVCKHYEAGDFYAYGTCRLEAGDRPGVLNSVDLGA